MSKREALPEFKRQILDRHARNEPRALANPAQFLAERKLPIPATREEQETAVRTLFADMRKAHGVE